MVTISFNPKTNPLFKKCHEASSLTSHSPLSSDHLNNTGNLKTFISMTFLYFHNFHFLGELFAVSHNFIDYKPNLHLLHISFTFRGLTTQLISLFCVIVTWCGNTQLKIFLLAFHFTP